MISKYSVAVYPAAHFDQQYTQIQEYISKAKQYGCTEIFSSAHLPELSLPFQLRCLAKLAYLVKFEQMTLTVDLGGASLNVILDDAYWAKEVKAMGIDFLRLDYGYEPSLMKRIIDELDIHGFVWNASIMNERDIKKHLDIIRQYPNIQIQVCHNFYPRPETGIDEAFMQQQYTYFHRYDIPVTTCAVSLNHPRGPLYEGLPTIEKHRHMSLEHQILDLIQGHATDQILIGDEFIKDEDFSILNNVLSGKPLFIHVHLMEGVTPLEVRLLYRTHQIRYDSNTSVLRSQSSRQMAEFAERIPARNQQVRKAFCITIDNERYERYSGEIQIVLRDLPIDERVNVIGYVDPMDTWKLCYFREGFLYDFIKK